MKKWSVLYSEHYIIIVLYFDFAIVDYLLVVSAAMAVGDVTQHHHRVGGVG